MPRTNLYDRNLVFELGGHSLLERFRAKWIGGNNFANGRTYEIMFISRMIIDMAYEWFALDAEGTDPYDVSEGLECLVDDAMTRRGENISYFQFKSGSVSEKPLVKDDFDIQQTLDELHNAEASYFLVVTPEFAKSTRTWIDEHEVRCELWVFPFATGLLAMLPDDKELQDAMKWLTGSHRSDVWLTLYDHIIAKWLVKRDYSVHELFMELVNQTRFCSSGMVNDDIRLHSFFSCLEYYEIFPDLADQHGVTLRRDIHTSDWFCVVPCTVRMLDEFDSWFTGRDLVSTGEIMMWFENYEEVEKGE
ncbi:hypothetical protein IB265_14165 [Ensifer sp. ENS10]|uniref:hypothetical protein n=2 Tax=unclassified Ensifer TaxID=2633371 RepID=UPI00177B0F52|nr:hypothetical protein [Ensifer sp. ENS10]MBD9507929.1 hypothetical protein [Ensifer sp. ENS10]